MKNFIAVCWVLVFAATISHAADEAELGTQARRILGTYCHRCHKGEGSESGYAFNVKHAASLIDGSVVVESDSESSELYGAMFRGRMPPRNRPQLPRPSAEEVEIVKRWIEAGAKEFPTPKPRDPISLKTTLQQIHRHVSDASRDDLTNLRFFSLTHLYNDPDVDEDYLRTTRAALSKAINGMSWEPRISLPKAIDDNQTVFAIDLSELGWTREHWNELVAKYPYAVSYGSQDDSELDELDGKIQRMRGSRESYILRADWFVAVATKPPLYHSLLFDLTLPELRQRHSDPKNTSNPRSMTVDDLEQFLGVHRFANILSGKAQRAGFTESGVSGQNRLVEWHPLQGRGYYWISYDFKSSNRTASLSEFPLGPSFDKNPFNDLAFEHDGGEVIFSLPNGLQGYMLIDGKGNRIDAGPIEVVSDSLKTSGNEQIVTGLSCMACHRKGMIETPDDETRAYSGALGDAKRQVVRLYPDNAEMKRIIETNQKSFAPALEAATEPFLDSAKGSVDDQPEPIGEVARHYFLDSMTIETVAAELGVTRATLESSLRGDPVLQRLGLRVLLREGGSIKRAAWESPSEFPLMKQTARQLNFDPM